MSDHSNDSSRDGPYARAARIYAANRWHPLPVPDGGKGKVPAGFTGYAARKVGEADITRWVDEQDLGGSNVCLRLFYEAGIDIVSYDPTKKAREAWKRLCAEHGEPPPTVRVSARFAKDYDGLAGIRIYRLPRKYRPLVEQRVWRSQIGSGIDLIRLGHRHVVCWPSVHPKLGTAYQWLDERTGEIHDGPLPSPRVPARTARCVGGEGAAQQRPDDREEACVARSRRFGGVGLLDRRQAVQGRAGGPGEGPSGTGGRPARRRAEAHDGADPARRAGPRGRAGGD